MLCGELRHNYSAAPLPARAGNGSRLPLPSPAQVFGLLLALCGRPCGLHQKCGGLVVF